MLNPLTLAGLALALLGLGLAAAGIAGAVRGAARRARYRRIPLQRPGEGVWSGAVAARDVYVPGTIARRTLLALAGLLVVAAGAPLAWAGLELGAGYARIDGGAPLADVTWRGGHVVVDRAAGGRVEGQLVGGVVVAHVEAITFRGIAARLGLGSYARLTHVTSYPDVGAVLAGRGTAMVDVAGPGALHRALGRIAGRARGTLEVSRRFSRPLRAGEPALLWASPDELAWRFDGR